jgi:polyisoprenoid-binding protein YceI
MSATSEKDTMKATYKVDSAHSSAQFSIRHMMISNVRGGFSKVDGTVEYDPDDPTSATIEAAIDASTIKTLDDQRDAHLKSADFLDVEKFPSIAFKSSKITLEGDGEATVTGDLTIHGVTHPITLKVEGPTAEGKDPWGNVRIGASATTKIKRSEFGLTFNAALETGGFMLGDDLKIEIEVELIKAAAAA